MSTKAPPNDNMRTYSTRSYKRNEKQHSDISQQQIWKRMTLEIHFMCKKLQRYVEYSQIKCKKECLEYETSQGGTPQMQDGTPQRYKGKQEETFQTSKGLQQIPKDSRCVERNYTSCLQL